MTREDKVFVVMIRLVGNCAIDCDSCWPTWDDVERNCKGLYENSFHMANSIENYVNGQDEECKKLLWKKVNDASIAKCDHDPHIASETHRL